MFSGIDDDRAARGLLRACRASLGYRRILVGCCSAAVSGVCAAVICIWCSVGFWLQVPIFLGTAIAAMTLFLVWQQRRMREASREVLRDAGRCVKCGYDISDGRVRCPECGTDVTRP